MTTAVALGTLGAVSTQAQDFKSENQKELSGLLNEQETKQNNMIEITQHTLTDDGVELAPGRYIKTEWYASNLYFQEGSDVFFVAKKDVPRRSSNDNNISRWTNTNKEDELTLRDLNIPQTVRFLMVPAAWTMRGSTDVNLESKFQTVADSLSNKSAEIGQGVGPTYNYSKCENTTSLDNVDPSLYATGDYYQTMQNIIDRKYDNNNNEVWIIYFTNADYPPGISWNSIQSPGDNLIGTTYGAISIKGSGSPTNLNPIIPIVMHEAVHLQGVNHADGNPHKATPANLMQPIVSQTNIHPETRSNTSGMGWQENGDNGPQSSCELLPLELLSFTGEKLKNGNNKLTWSVAQEIDVLWYDIEYSDNWKNRENLGTVAASNNPWKHNYSFSDIQERNAVSYYRLNMKDKNGDESYSPVTTIKWSEKESSVYFSPNPTKWELKLTLNQTGNGVVKASVYDILGNMMTELDINNYGTLTLPEQDGVYIIKSEDSQGNHYTQKIVKN